MMARCLLPFAGLLLLVIVGHMPHQPLGLSISHTDELEDLPGTPSVHDGRKGEFLGRLGEEEASAAGNSRRRGEGRVEKGLGEQLAVGDSYVPFRQHKFDLNDFGAVGDGKTDNTRAFMNGVYACSIVSKSGGSQLYVPPGTYVTHPFNLTSHMTLYLAHGATILGTTDLVDWDLIDPLPSYGRGWDLPGPRYANLISGYLIRDVVITGENGTLDGRGSFWWNLLEKKQLRHTRPHLLEFLHVRGAIVANVTFRNSPFWTIHPVYSFDVTLRDVTIINPADSPDTDGITPDSSQNVLIQDAFVSTGGDAVSLKSGWDQYGIKYNMECCNIHARNLILHSQRGAAFAVGSEMSGGVRNVTLENVSIEKSANGVVVKTGRGRGGMVSNITVKALYMSSVRTAINFTAFCEQHPDAHFNPKALPVVRDVSLSDIVASNIQVAASFDGLKEAPFQRVSLENIILGLAPKGKGFCCSNVNGWAKNVHPKPCPQLKFLEWPFLDNKAKTHLSFPQSHSRKTLKRMQEALLSD